MSAATHEAARAGDAERTEGPHGHAGGEHGEGEHAGYETADVDVGNTYKVVGALGLTVALVIGTLLGMNHLFAARQRADRPPLTAQQTARITPPAPNLQANPYLDIARLTDEQAARLGGYAYTDALRTRARIPLERARALILGKSLEP